MSWVFRFPAVLVVLVLLGAARFAHADTAVIVGAGQIGSWSAHGSVANPNFSTEALTIAPVPFPCQPPMECPLNPVILPPFGSATLDSFLSGAFQTLYVTQQESSPAAFPLIQANLRNSSPATVDIPVVLLSKLMSANISTLNFPGVVEEPPPPCAFPIRCYAAHSALVLASIRRTDTAPIEDLPVLLELFGSDGTRLASASLTVPYGSTVLISDVVAYVGGAGGPLGVGQLRVTRANGGALMWGILYTQAFDGTVTASAGVNLSP
jgi:hypothetical protein